MDFKKLIWRAIRGSVYASVSLFLGSKLGDYLPPEAVTAIATGLLLAVDKAFGVGALVSGAPAK